jgi:predicted O-methyltransferase YrrM
MYSNLKLAKKYINYYFSALSSKGHGVHSPFVFDFIKLVKNDHKKYDCFQPVEDLRKQLLSDKTFIEVEDFGAGSTVIKTNKRRIDKMAASSLKPRKFAQLLFRIVQFYQPKTILELGTSFGISSAYLASGHNEARLYTIEGAASIANIARLNFNMLSLKNIEVIEGDFSKTLTPLLQELQGIDLAFIDGNHRKDPTMQYFNQLLNKSDDSTILIFDDIHWSKEMEDAWENIKAHPSVTLTIDLFFIGIIFFRKEFKAVQHFSIRF